MTTPASEIETLMVENRAAAHERIDHALKALHGSGQSRELCALHCLAADYWCDDPDQAAFHMTHAYVYALEAGDVQAEARLFEQLAERGRI